jgi:hypothetical protein
VDAEAALGKHKADLETLEAERDAIHGSIPHADKQALISRSVST